MCVRLIIVEPQLERLIKFNHSVSRYLSHENARSHATRSASCHTSASARKQRGTDVPVLVYRIWSTSVKQESTMPDTPSTPSSLRPGIPSFSPNTLPSLSSHNPTLSDILSHRTLSLSHHQGVISCRWSVTETAFHLLDSLRYPVTQNKVGIICCIVSPWNFRLILHHSSDIDL